MASTTSNNPRQVAAIESPRPVTPSSPHLAAVPFAQPVKLKGRQRLLQGLQRMSSSPSLVKMGRNRSNERVYKPNHKASISCISLGSPMSACSSSSPIVFSAPSSHGYSTAPTTPGSPGSQQSYFEANVRLRTMDYGGTASVPVPSSSKAMILPEISEKPLPRRLNFNFWADLPHEIRVQIFSYLPPKEIIRMSSVSKAWHDMCFDGQLWTSLDCQSYYQQITSDALIKIMLRAGAFVKNLNLRGCVQLRDQWLSLGTRMTDQECRNLEMFSIEGCKIERSSIHFFLLRNPKLLHINMPSMQNVNNATMKIIAAHCPQLELLNIDWCSQIDTRGLIKVIQACPNLTDLRASEVRGLDENDFMLELFQRNKLERLFLQHCDSLTDEALQIMIHGLNPEIDVLTDRPIVPPRRLRHLDISKCQGLTDTGVNALSHNVPFLEGLRLCQNTALTDAALSTLVTTTPKLSHLEVEELDQLTNTLLQGLANSRASEALEHLSVSYCEQIGDVGVLPIIKQCPNLRSLCLDNTRISDLVLIEASDAVRQRGHLTRRGARPRKGLDLIAFDCANVTWAGVREVMQANCRVMQGRKKSVVQPAILQPHFHKCPAQASVNPVSATAAPRGTPEQPETSLTPASSPPSVPYQATNAESIRRIIEIQTLLYPAQTIHLKAFYGWQQTLDEHYKRCMTARWGAAARLEGKWAEWMVASEEVSVAGHGWSSRRRRRRAREAENRVRDDEEDLAAGTGDDDEIDFSGPEGAAGGRRPGMGRRRARSGGCLVM